MPAMHLLWLPPPRLALIPLPGWSVPGFPIGETYPAGAWVVYTEMPTNQVSRLYQEVKRQRTWKRGQESDRRLMVS